jgi:hypothetical protein
MPIFKEFLKFLGLISSEKNTISNVKRKKILNRENTNEKSKSVSTNHNRNLGTLCPKISFKL